MNQKLIKKYLSNSFPNSHYRFLLNVMLLFVFISLAGFANGQSTDRDKPTPITSNKASLFFDVSNTNEGFYHSFAANPGELKITFSLEAGKNSVNQIELDVFDENARKLATKNITSGLGRTEQTILRVNIEKKQTLLFRITVYHANGEGQYRLQLEGGNVIPSENISSQKLLYYFPDAYSTKAPKGVNFNFQVLTLPKTGQLSIKMKDGTIIIIDLSEISSSFIDPR